MFSVQIARSLLKAWSRHGRRREREWRWPTEPQKVTHTALCNVNTSNLLPNHHHRLSQMKHLDQVLETSKYFVLRQSSYRSFGTVCVRSWHTKHLPLSECLSFSLSLRSKCMKAASCISHPISFVQTPQICPWYSFAGRQLTERQVSACARDDNPRGRRRARKRNFVS